MSGFKEGGESPLPEPDALRKLAEEARQLPHVTREQFDREHCRCPKCGSASYRSTYIGVVYVVGEDFSDTVNTVECGSCGWSGRPIDLVDDTVGEILQEDGRGEFDSDVQP